MVRPSEMGAIAPIQLPSLITAAELTANSLSISALAPQVFRPRAEGASILMDTDTLWSIDESDFTLTAVLFRDFYDTGTPITISYPANTATAEKLWHFVDFGSTWFLINDHFIIVKSNWIDPTRVYLLPNGGASPRIRAGCDFNGRMIRGGFDTSDYWLAAWTTLWTEWMTEMGNWGLGQASAPGPNWVWWSNIGGGDLLDVFLPSTNATVGAEGITFDLGDDPPGKNLVVNGDFRFDPNSGVRHDHLTESGTWVDNVGNDNLAEWAFQTDSLQLTVGESNSLWHRGKFLHRTLIEGESYEVVFSLQLSDVSDGITPELGGTAGTLRTGSAGPTVFTETIVCGGTAIDSEGLTLLFNVDGVAAGTIAIRAVSLKRLGFLTGTTTPNDAMRPKAWEDFEKNQSGFLVMDWQGPVLNTKALRVACMVYGEDGISAIKHENAAGLGISTFGLVNNVLKGGITSRTAVGGNPDRHFFIDDVGYLWTIGNDLEPERLGFKDHFGEFLGGGVSLVYDELEQDLYISNEDDESFILDRDGHLSMHNQRVLSGFNLQGGFPGIVDDVTAPTAFQVTSNLTDFGYRGLKTVGFVEIEYEDVSDLRLTVEYRYDRNSALQTTPAIPGSEDGSFYVGIAATDFRFIVSGSNIGADQLQNGDFSSATGWTIDGAIGIHVIAGGQFSRTVGGPPTAAPATQEAADLTTALVEEDIYRVEYEIVAIANGFFNVELGDVSGAQRDSVGTFTENIRALGSDLKLTLNHSPGTVYDLEFVSVKRVGMRISRIDVRYDIQDNRVSRSPRVKQLGVQ